jgi:predicted short-subunit dehydrogenase-like oxidoreductase (DUF2520 family)
MVTLHSVSIVGTGNVAQVFGQKFHDSGIKIASIIGHNEEQLRELSNRWNTKRETLESASGDLILIAVPDKQVREITNQINLHKFVVYTAGSIQLDTILHPNCGVFYPLQTITKNIKGADFKFPLLIEAKNEALNQILFDLGSKISDTVEYCDSEKRIKIHLSAVFINNFTNHIIFLGHKIAKQNHINPTIFNDLLKETFDKLNQLEPYDAQTGPARRNDLKTIRQQIDMLDEHDRDLYITISNSILKTYLHEKL